MKNSTLKILRERQQRTIQRSKKAALTGRSGNPLIGSTAAELDGRNDFLNRLSRLASPVKVAPTQEVTSNDNSIFSSRHFFMIPEEYAETNKHATGSEILPEEPFNLEVIDRAEVYKSQVGNPVDFNIKMVSDFILDEITPLLLGLDGGVTRAQRVIQSTISEVDPYPFTALELLTREAIKLKLGSFIKNYFSLDNVDVNELVTRILPPKQREVVVPVPMEGSRYEARQSTARRAEKDKG